MSILEAITHMVEERGVSKDFVIDILKETLISAAQREYGLDTSIDVEISQADGSAKVFLVRKVVKRVTNSEQQVSLKEAHKVEPNLEPGDELRTELSLERFGRNAIILAKHILQQKIREKEKEKVYEEYMKKLGELETGIVQKVSRREIIVKLKNAEGILPEKEQILEERYYQGNMLKAYILDVTPSGRVLLSRTHPNFLRKLFKQEVPEIQEGIIEIKEVARIPGIRAKIAVTSNNPKVDPVGACVGVRGSRIQTVVKELNNEKIDVIQYSSDSMVFVSRALSSVKVLREEIDPKENKISVVIKDEELPQAIGKSGQNALLASKLTGFKINIISESEYKSKGVAVIPEISKSIKETLISHGFLTTTEILNRGVEELVKVPKIGKKRAEEIFAIAEKLMKE